MFLIPLQKYSYLNINVRILNEGYNFWSGEIEPSGIEVTMQKTIKTGDMLLYEMHNPASVKIIILTKPTQENLEKLKRIISNNIQKLTNLWRSENHEGIIELLQRELENAHIAITHHDTV